MKKCSTIAVFALICCLFSGCVSSNVIGNNELYLPEDTVFYINTIGDDLGVYRSFQEVLDRHSINHKLVTSINEVPDLALNESSGTAFFIAPDILVTNAHVITDDEDIVFVKDGVEEKAELLYKNTQNDLAFLRTRPFDIPYFRLAKQSEYDITQAIYVLGYPLSDILGNEIRVTNGIINSLSGIGGDSNKFQISAQIQPGNSGGPVIDDTYSVVGVGSSKISDSYMISTKNTIAQNINFAIKSNIVALFGEEYLNPNVTNYVNSMNEAIKATVKVSSTSNRDQEAEYYYVEYSFVASWDVIHYTAKSMSMNCYDVGTGDLAATTNQNYFSFSSIYAIAKNQLEKILMQLN